MSDKEDHKLIRIFADLFTTSGSVLRTINDLLPCSQCASAIPSEYVYNKMKEHKIKTLPEKIEEVKTVSLSWELLEKTRRDLPFLKD